jgi:hypothetical protein
MVSTLKDTQEAYNELIAFLSDHNLIGYLEHFSEDSQARLLLVLNDYLKLRRLNVHPDAKRWAEDTLDYMRYFLQEASTVHDEQQTRIEELEAMVQATTGRQARAS